ncbi:MAG: hypothetical protein A3G75_06680, partial [Verrucomicrobia bacterium RIFCSPLOWO2_12_FULL_64_8]
MIIRSGPRGVVPRKVSPLMNTRIFLPPLQIALITVVGLLLPGCAHTYEMKVDSLSKPTKANQAVSYKLRNKNQSPADATLRQKEAEEFVKTALSGKGMYEAPDSLPADMVVDIDYGIEAPRIRYERSSVPVYAEVGGGVRYETIQVGYDPRTRTPIYRTVAIYEPPRTELIGYQEVVTPAVVYEKYLRIVARENQPSAEGKPPQEIWSVQVSSED